MSMSHLVSSRRTAWVARKFSVLAARLFAAGSGRHGAYLPRSEPLNRCRPVRWNSGRSRELDHPELSVGWVFRVGMQEQGAIEESGPPSLSYRQGLLGFGLCRLVPSVGRRVR